MLHTRTGANTIPLQVSTRKYETQEEEFFFILIGRRISDPTLLAQNELLKASTFIITLHRVQMRETNNRGLDIAADIPG